MATEPEEPDFAYLTTSGRISGNPHRIEIWFAIAEETVYLLAGGGDRSDWVRNLMVSPDVVLQIGDRKRHSRARAIPSGSEEDATARKLLVEKYTSRGSSNLVDWGNTSLPVAIDWPD
jgi:deazaflavin-dependent oxidoreductase (nitroreductase family)